MKRLLPLGVGVLLAYAGWAGAQPTERAVPPVPMHDNAAERQATAQAREQERESIKREQQAVDTRLQQAQAACYQRFAVEDCLQLERSKAREARARLSQRAAVLDDVERRERAAQRLDSIAERQNTRTVPVPAPVKRTERPSQADREARERAQRQQEKRAAHQAEQPHQIQIREEQAAQARQKQEEKREAAAAHKARVLQSQAEQAASGQKPAAPLPPAP